MWRYRELLPIDGEPTVGRQVGFTPLVKGDQLGPRPSGCRSSTSKNDAVTYPTLSFKDRVVSVALVRGPRIRFQGGGLRLHGKSRQFGGRQCGGGRF